MIRGSTGDRERDTWDDWCDSAFRNGYGGCFGMTTLPSRHQCCRTVEMRQCRHRQFSRVH